MRATHAIFAPIPETLKPEDKKTKLNMDLFQRQIEGLRSTLHEAGIHIVDLRSDSPPLNGVFAGDAAVIIRGVALLTRPKRDYSIDRRQELARVLSDMTWTVKDTPQQVGKTTVVLDGSDVLFTGREVFVGIRKNGTNMEGAMVLANTFPDFNVSPIIMSEKSRPLRYYVSMASSSVLSIGTAKEARNILQRLEHDASYRYRTITVEEETAVGCLYVNERIIFKSDMADPKFNALQGAGLELWALDLSELYKIGAPFSRYCLLVNCNAGSPAKMRNGSSFSAPSGMGNGSDL